MGYLQNSAKFQSDCVCVWVCDILIYNKTYTCGLGPVGGRVPHTFGFPVLRMLKVSLVTVTR